MYKPWVVGYVGFMSFGAKWWGGYRRHKAGGATPENEEYQSRLHYTKIMEQAERLKDVTFVCGSYLELSIPDNSIIYCDPPYEGTTKYLDSFDHSMFWQWCREKKAEGHRIFISEYNAPEDFTCVWDKPVSVNIHAKGSQDKARVEKLFTL